MKADILCKIISIFPIKKKNRQTIFHQFYWFCYKSDSSSDCLRACSLCMLRKEDVFPFINYEQLTTTFQSLSLSTKGMMENKHLLIIRVRGQGGNLGREGCLVTFRQETSSYFTALTCVIHMLC